MPPWYEPGYGLVPTRIALDPGGEAFTIYTSMFMHANLMHLGGNMLFLWIFGDNVEDALGHARYLAFYLGGGTVAAIVQVATNFSSPLPMVGASGAIAAVTGAYLVLFPRAPVLILNPIPFTWLFWGLTWVVPAWIVVGEFFLVNLLGSAESLHTQALTNQAPQGGVAVFAHLGGFLAGLLAILPLTHGRKRTESRKWEGWRPPPRGPSLR